MKAVSAVIVVILLLMISISLASLAYFFFTRMITRTTETGTELIEQTTTSMLAQMKIESISYNKLYIRNTGQTNLTGFSVYVNDELVNISAPSSIEEGQVGNITIYNFINGGDIIKVTSAEGAIGTITSPDTCDSSSVVLCLNFDDCTAKDSSNYGNDGTLVNGPACIDEKYGKALQFDGVDDYVNISDSASLDITNAITVEMWIKPKGGWSNTQEGLLSKEPVNNAYLLFLYWGGEIRWRITTGGSYDTLGYATSLSEQWYHLAATYDSSSSLAKIFLDGTEVANKTLTTGAIDTTIGELRVGNYGGGPTFNGIIDEVRIYNKVIY